MNLTRSHTLTDEFDLRFYLEALEFTLVEPSDDEELIYHKENYYVYIFDKGYIEIHINDIVYGEMYGSWRVRAGFFIVDTYRDICIELLKVAVRKVKLQLLDTNETIESRYKAIKEKCIQEQITYDQLCKAEYKARYPERFYIGPDGQEYYINDVDNVDPDEFFDSIK